ncbi:hypothetical protein KOR34_12820 [Posidoniimonas corsicana]|uniref:Uncharacterized protein n=2 Tax=Posidoniimonas corsicana TaxID=1938618 RepID=A0A5C5VEM6_9BACT|nr:hypothetical protein KOR34_12820 [Posidoniimonas corsicana]
MLVVKEPHPMLKATVVAAGLLMAATQKTPFDLMDVHISSTPLVELSICVLVLIAVLASDK